MLLKLLQLDQARGDDSFAGRVKYLSIDNEPNSLGVSSTHGPPSNLIAMCFNVEELTLRIGAAGHVKTVGVPIARALAKATKMKHIALNGITVEQRSPQQIACSNLKM